MNLNLYRMIWLVIYLQMFLQLPFHYSNPHVKVGQVEKHQNTTCLSLTAGIGLYTWLTPHPSVCLTVSLSLSLSLSVLCLCQFIIKSVYYGHTRLTTSHTCIFWVATQDTHTRACMPKRSEWIFPLHFPILDCPSSRAARSSGQPLWRPGTKSSDPSVLVRDGQESGLFFCMFFCWGS